jgi:serine/threonine protein kinase
MEYFPHSDLGRYITAGFTEGETKIIATQLLEGLEVMHANDFAHRDLKPQVGLRNLF